MTHNLKASTLLAAALYITGPTTARAEGGQVTSTAETVVENAQERINFSGKLRMLSQRIPAAACHAEHEIATEAALTLLGGANVEFEKILTALEFGDADLNIVAPEAKRRTLARIHQLREVWEPFKGAATSVVEGSADDADLSYLFAENLAVLSAAQLLVEELVRQYSNPNAVTQASLMLIDISGRQRMLTQKMSKEACISATPFATDSIRADLAGTAQIFEASLEALRFGMPQVGIGAPPSAEIAEGLQGVLEDWTLVEPMIDQVIDGGDLAHADHAVKFNRLNVTMANMNTVVGMYAAAARPDA